MMKSNFLYTFLTILFYAFTNFAFGQDTIKLIVDTSGIRPGANTKNSCYFEGQDKGDNPEDFLSIVAKNATLMWIGESESKNDSISIFKIKYIRGTNIFDKDSIMSSRGKKFVTDSIINPTEPDKDYKYKVFFKINGRPGYWIDPLIRTNNTIIPKNQNDE